MGVKKTNHDKLWAGAFGIVGAAVLASLLS
jgi:hypothetical protein